MNKKEKQVYEETFEMYDGCCAFCGSPQIHMHHIRYGGLYGGRKTYLGNIIPLCKPHHDLVHTDKGKYMPMLIDMIDEKLGRKIYD
jgi:5-methylcytosine-specific restriction endonuclease McrA